MTDIFIDNLGFALGSTKLVVEDNPDRYFSPVSAMLDSGFITHYVCAEQESAYDLARRCTEEVSALLTEKNKSICDMNAIIYATCLTRNGNIGSWEVFAESKDVKSLMDFPASHLQADFSMDDAFVFGLNQMACTSLLGSIRVARNLLIAEPETENVLCLTADRFPLGAKYEQGFNIISDGAAACTVSRSPGAFKILGCHHITNGAMSQANDDETAGFYFNYTHRLIIESLERCRLSIEDVAWIVPQNTSVKAWQVLCSLLGFKFEDVLMPTIGRVGHCISGDNVINLKHSDDINCFESGDIITMPMAGFGLNWSCVILQKV